MASFEKENSGGVLSVLSKALKKLTNVGMEYEDMVIRQSKAVGVVEAEFGNKGYLDEAQLYSLALADIGPKKFIAYFDKEYPARRENLRNFALNSEIEFILDIISDESIVYDSANFFCELNVNKLRGIFSEDIADKIIEDISYEFKRLYSLFNFNQGHDAWNYFRQFLIDGFLAFEIIYDDMGKNIIGFKELDPISLMPIVQKNENGVYQKYWIQYNDDPRLKRILPDTSIIYISYSRGNFTSRVSYVERLVRVFNLLRLMENSRIVWNIINTSLRIKTVVPISTKSAQRAREALAEFRGMYKEEINVDFNSGELTINGSPALRFFKNYVIPSKGGEQIDISVLDTQGYDLSNTDIINYFKNKLKEESKVPFERFDREGGGGVYNISAEGANREEIRFFKFITRLRSIFQEIIIKPLYLQVCLKYPELIEDNLFKANLSIDYVKDNIFQESKEAEILKSRADLVNSLMGIMTKTKDAQGMDVDVPYFHPEFLIEKYLKLSPEEISENKELKKKKELEDLETMKKQKEIMGDEGGAGGGLGF